MCSRPLPSTLFTSHLITNHPANIHPHSPRQPHLSHSLQPTLTSHPHSQHPRFATLIPPPLFLKPTLSPTHPPLTHMLSHSLAKRPSVVVVTKTSVSTRSQRPTTPSTMVAAVVSCVYIKRNILICEYLFLSNIEKSKKRSTKRTYKEVVRPTPVARV